MNTIFVLVISALITSIFFALRKKEQALLAAQKILAVALVLTVTANNFLNDAFLDVINGGWRGGIYYNTSDHLQVVLRWLQAVSYIVLPVAIFGKLRFFKNVAILFCLPVAIAYAFQYSSTMAYYTTVSTQIATRGYVVSEVFRHIILSAELVISTTLPLCILLFQKHRPNFRNKELLLMLLLMPLLILLQMPPYAPQAIFGLVKTDLPDVQMQWILATFLITVALIVAFRFKNRQTRLEVSWLLTLAVFMYYNNTFLMGLNIRRLPLQLCNIASYFMLFAMLFKKTSFFNFVFLANVTGTLIAMLLPEAAEKQITSYYAVRYIFQHSLVFIVPCVVLGLRIFPRLTKKSMISSAAGFSLYWAFCLIFGAYVNAHPEIFNMSFNLFYLFDMEIYTYLFPWSITLQTPVEIFGLTFRPAIQILVLVGFYALTCLLFLATVSLNRFSDDHLVLRLKLIEIYEKKTGKKSKLPREFVD